MQIVLSWDLLVILFTALVVAYSFIVGKDESVKIIVATYIAVVAVQAIGNLLQVFLSASASTAAMVGIALPIDVLAVIKLALFATFIVCLAIRGGISVTSGESLGSVWDIVIQTALGFSTAGLLLASLITYVANQPLLDLFLGDTAIIGPILPDNPLVEVVVDYQHFWFALPAIVLLILGFLNRHNAE